MDMSIFSTHTATVSKSAPFQKVRRLKKWRKQNAWNLG